MDRKRVLTIVGVVVVVLLVLAGIAVARAWPMISGEKVVVGPTADAEELEEFLPPIPKSIDAPATEVPEQPDVSADEVSEQSLTRTAALSEADLIVGLWVCVQGNTSQTTNSGYLFLAPEQGTVGSLYVTEDVTVEEPEWIEAEYELGVDGYLVISPVSFGMWPVSTDYVIQFDQIEGYDVMYMWSLDPDDEGDTGAVMAKVPAEASDSAWNAFQPEPYDPEVYRDPTTDELNQAVEITEGHYPQFQVETVLVQDGDPDTSDYPGNCLLVEAFLKTNPDVRMAVAHYVEADAESTVPSWTESESMPSAYEGGTTTDGTRYIWNYVDLEALQSNNLDPAVDSLLGQIAVEYPESVLFALGLEDQWAYAAVTRWDAYPTYWNTGFFELKYGDTGSGWQLESSTGP